MLVNDVDIVVSVFEVSNKSNLEVLGTELLQGGIGIQTQVNGRLFERNVVELSMAIRLGCLESGMSGLEGGEWCARTFAVQLQGGAGMKCIKR